MTSRPELEIRLLGRFAVRKDGAEVPAADFGGRKVRALVRILASRRGSFVGNDVLTEFLWPDRAPADPAANVQVLVNRARRAMADPAAIRTGTGGYALDDGIAVDAEQFIATVAAADALTARAAFDTLLDALRGWGEPLPEDAYAEWAQEPRGRLLRIRQTALEHAAQLGLDLGDNAAAVELASEAADAEPLREVAALTLVRALAAAGDAAGALGKFDEYRRALRDELGVDPSADAQQLHQRLLRSAPAAPSTGAPRPARPTRFGELPFVGRTESVLATVTALSADNAAVVVRGPSGSGKSRFLDTIAARASLLIARAYLPERAEPFSLVRTLLRELVAQDIGAVERLPAPLHAALAGLLPEYEDVSVALDAESRRALVTETVLRLLEQFRDVAIAIDDVQWADPSSLGVIETARARLPGLRLVVAFRPEDVDSDIAQWVLRLRADASVELGGLGRTELAELVADDELADAIAGSSDATPLAVTEVLRALASDGLITRTADGRWHALDPTSTGRARELAHQGQRRVIEMRVRAQPAERRTILDAVALRGGEVPAALLAEVSGDGIARTHDHLSALHRAGLVRLGGSGWAGAHDMVTEVVAATVDSAQHARLHAALAEALDRTGEDAIGSAHHWRAARETARAADAYARAARGALDEYADAEAVRLADAGLALRPTNRIASELQEVRAQARARTGDIAGARSDLSDALAAHPSGPDRARLLGRLAMVASGADDLVRASELAELALVEAGSDVAARAQALETASVLDMNLDQPERAAMRSAEALARYQELGDARGTARVLDATAMATFLAGDVRGGGAALHRVADLFEDSGELVRVMTPRSTAGHAFVFGGASAEGLALASSALELARTLGHPEGQAYALWHRAEAFAALAAAGEAMTAAREALDIATSIGHRGWTATAHRAVGIAAQASGDLDAALDSFERSLASSEHLDLFACWAAARAALVLVQLGDLDRATPLASRALRTGPPLGHFEARLAAAELAAARRDANSAALARTALGLADTAGVAQGRDRLVELAQPAG